ncbi:MAG: alpha/beta hydrolase [Pseudomonadota bacterium]
MSDHVSHFLENGHIQTAYNEIGDNDTIPLVLIHGFTGSKLDFANQLNWFAQDRRVIALDQRGHGESTNQGPYDFYGLVHDLFGFLDQMDIKQCHLLGHSMGGMVAMRALLAEPHRFASAILMDTAAEPLTLFPDKIREQLNEIVIEKGCEALLEGMRNQTQNEAVKRSMDYLGEAEHWRRIRVKLEQMDPQAFVELGACLGKAPPVLESLKTLSLPVTVVVGEEDTPFLKPSELMAAALPLGRLVTIPDAAHSPQYENPQAWRAVIEAHLTQSP